MDFPDFGDHPAGVLSVHLLNSRLGHVAVVPVTGTRGPASTHIPLSDDAGLTLTRSDESYADVTGLQPIDRARLLRHRGRLSTGELSSIAAQLEVCLGLWPR